MPSANLSFDRSDNFVVYFTCILQVLIGNILAKRTMVKRVKIGKRAGLNCRSKIFGQHHTHLDMCDVFFHLVGGKISTITK